MARLLALLAWPLAIAGGLAARLAGRDPLRLRRPPAGSLWIERAQPSPSSYFSEDGGEGRGHGGLAGRVLIALAPARWRTRAARASAKDPARVPDEIYTLW